MIIFSGRLHRSPHLLYALSQLFLCWIIIHDLIISLPHDDAKSLTAGAKTWITMKSLTHWCFVNVYWLNKLWMTSQIWSNLLWAGYSDLVFNFVKAVISFHNIASSGLWIWDPVESPIHICYKGILPPEGLPFSILFYRHFTKYFLGIIVREKNEKEKKKKERSSLGTGPAL